MTRPESSDQSPPRKWDGMTVRCLQCEQRMSPHLFFDREAHACWAAPDMTVGEALSDG